MIFCQGIVWFAVLSVLMQYVYGLVHNFPYLCNTLLLLLFYIIQFIILFLNLFAHLLKLMCFLNSRVKYILMVRFHYFKWSQNYYCCGSKATYLRWYLQSENSRIKKLNSLVGWKGRSNLVWVFKVFQTGSWKVILKFRKPLDNSVSAHLWKNNSSWQKFKYNASIFFLNQSLRWMH